MHRKLYDDDEDRDVPSICGYFMLADIITQFYNEQSPPLHLFFYLFLTEDTALATPPSISVA